MISTTRPGSGSRSPIQSPPPAAHSPRRVLIGIPTRDRDAQLSECLASLEGQWGAEFSVLVVDNGTRECTLPPTHTFPLTCVRQAPGLTASRNTLLRHFREGEHTDLVFLDDDQRAPQGWLSELVSASRQHPDSIIAGPVDYLGLLESNDPALRDIMQRWSAGRPPGVLRPDQVGAGNTLVPRHLMEIAGWPGFDASFDAGGEDTAFFAGLAEQGVTFWCASNATVQEVFDPSRLTRQWFARREITNGRAIGIMSLKDPVHARLLAESLGRVGVGAVLGLVRSIRGRHVWPQDFNEFWGGLGRLLSLVDSLPRRPHHSQDQGKP